MKHFMLVYLAGWVIYFYNNGIYYQILSFYPETNTNYAGVKLNLEVVVDFLNFFLTYSLPFVIVTAVVLVIALGRKHFQSEK